MSANTSAQYRPLYAAGFVTAFGAHSIAASLGVYSAEPTCSPSACCWPCTTVPR